MEIDGHHIGESLAIIEYLEETRQTAHSSLPSDPCKFIHDCYSCEPIELIIPSVHLLWAIVLRARARQLALIVVSDIQPVQNLRVLNRIATKYGGDEQKQDWAKHWIEFGLKGKHSLDGPLSAGECFISVRVLCAK